MKKWSERKIKAVSLALTIVVFILAIAFGWTERLHEAIGNFISFCVRVGESLASAIMSSAAVSSETVILIFGWTVIVILIWIAIFLKLTKMEIRCTEKKINECAYTDALKHAKSALRLSKLVFPIGKARHITPYYYIGHCLYMLSMYDDALENYDAALNICKKNLPKNHPTFIEIHSSLAALYSDLGKVEQSQIHNKDVSDIQQKGAPVNSFYNDESILYPFALLFHDVDFSTINKFLLKCEKSLSKYPFLYRSYCEFFQAKLPGKAVFHNKRGQFCIELGKYDEALEEFNLALEICKEYLASDGLTLAVIHNNIGVTYHYQSNPEMALTHLKLALDLYKSILPDEHDDMAMLYDSFGSVYLQAGDYSKAKIYQDRALKIRKAIFPAVHKDIALSHTNIGTFYFNLGLYSKALGHFSDALNINKEIFAKDHPSIANSHRNIAVTYYNMDDITETIKNALLLINSIPDLYQAIISTTNNVIRDRLLRVANTHQDFINTVWLKIRGEIKNHILYNVLLQMKDIGAEAEIAIRMSNLPGRYPAVASKLSQLQGLVIEKDHLEMNDPEKKDEIETLASKIQDLEIGLAKYVREIDFKSYMKNMTAKSILDNLPKGRALIEYGRFNYVSSALDTNISANAGGMYYAYVLLGREITLVYLGASAPIDGLINTVREKTIVKKKDDIPKNADSELSALFKILIQPFTDILQGIDHLYIAPDSDLYKLPFELLRTPGGEYLGDLFTISYLSSGRSLLRQESCGVPNEGSEGRAILITNPQYSIGADSEAALDENHDNEDTPRSGMPTMPQAADEPPKVIYKELSAAEIEGDTLSKMFKGEIVTYHEDEATKNVLHELKGPSPSIIHIVTHGFYEQPFTSSHSLAYNGINTHAYSKDPMMRSGLVFSGVNNWLRSDKQKLIEKYGNGILSAKEILTLDLSNTQLVVLSACHSGEGEVQNSEGIKGLRRAFELAGVGSLICTLWKVDDIPSALLMKSFYENLLSNPATNNVKALTFAKNYVKNITFGEIYNYLKVNGYDTHTARFIKLYSGRRHSSKPYNHPFYWAGYILQGDF